MTHAVSNWTFSSPVISCQRQVEGYAADSRDADLKLPAVVLEYSLVCFEVYTPQSVLTSIRRATAVFTSYGRIGLTSMFFCLFVLEGISKCDYRCSFLLVKNRICILRYSYSKSTWITVTESKPMQLSQFSQSIDSLSEIYVAFQGRPPAVALAAPSPPYRRVTVTQERWARCRVIPTDTPFASKSHIHRNCRTIREDLNEIPHTKPELPAELTLLLDVFFFFFFFLSTASVNLRSKCFEKTIEDDEEVGKLKERKRKKHKMRTKQPSWCTFATASE